MPKPVLLSILANSFVLLLREILIACFPICDFVKLLWCNAELFTTLEPTEITEGKTVLCLFSHFRVPVVSALKILSS